MTRIIIGSFFSGAVTVLYIFSIVDMGYIALFGLAFWLAVFGLIVWSGVRSIRNKNKKIEVK